MAGAHTFLFSDLVGFTALTDAEGDERAADVATDFCRRVRELLPEHRTEEIKSIGDAVMLRADDPALGIRLGLRIVDELERVEGFPAVRVGIHTGGAVCRDGDWYGATVNVAARLCSAAAGGQVLASEEAVAAAGALHDLELGERRLHWLKNVTEPVSARTVAARERFGRFRRRLSEVGALLGPAAGSPA